MKLFSRSLFSVFFLISTLASTCRSTITVPTLAPRTSPQLDFAAIRDRAIDTTVRVRSQNRMMASYDGGGYREAIGAGIVIGAGPLVLTANHHVRDSTGVVIAFPLRGDATTREIPMRIVRSSEDRDVALLAPREGSTDAVSMLIARKTPSPGDPIWFYGRTSAMSSGTILDDQSIVGPRGRLIETDMVSSNGDSGAPCMNDRGELIGVLILGTNGGPHTYCVRIDDAFSTLGITPKN